MLYHLDILLKCYFGVFLQNINAKKMKKNMLYLFNYNINEIELFLSCISLFWWKERLIFCFRIVWILDKTKRFESDEKLRLWNKVPSSIIVTSTRFIFLVSQNIYRFWFSSPSSIPKGLGGGPWELVTWIREKKRPNVSIVGARNALII